MRAPAVQWQAVRSRVGVGAARTGQGRWMWICRVGEKMDENRVAGCARARGEKRRDYAFGKGGDGVGLGLGLGLAESLSLVGLRVKTGGRNSAGGIELQLTVRLTGLSSSFCSLLGQFEKAQNNFNPQVSRPLPLTGAACILPERVRHRGLCSTTTACSSQSSSPPSALPSSRLSLGCNTGQSPSLR